MVLTLMDELSPASAGRLVEAGARRTYSARSFVFIEGDHPSSVSIVESGLLRVDRTLRSGRSVLLTLKVPGELVGELSLIDATPRSATIAAITESRLIVVPADRFNKLLATDRELARVILTQVTRRLRALTDQFVETAAHSATSRVAARLVELSRVFGRSEEPFDLRMPITQEELAQWAGLSREAAVKGLAELRLSGVIETGRRRITVLDVASLRQAALATSG